MDNRWFTKTGRIKRVPKNLESMRYLAIRYKDRLISNSFGCIEATKIIREEFNLDLRNSLDVMVAFIGVYNNESPVFNETNYLAGMKLIDSGMIQLRTKELVN